MVGAGRAGGGAGLLGETETGGGVAGTRIEVPVAESDTDSPEEATVGEVSRDCRVVVGNREDLLAGLPAGESLPVGVDRECLLVVASTEGLLAGPATEGLLPDTEGLLVEACADCAATIME